MAEWSIAISLKLILVNTNIRSNRIFSDIYNYNGLEPGWLGASFGLRICYVRTIITRKLGKHIYMNSNIKYITQDMNCKISFTNDVKYKKKLLGKINYCMLREVI